MRLCRCGLAMYMLPGLGSSGPVYVCEDCDPHLMGLVEADEQ